MQVDAHFNTTFASDEEAREYARAAKAYMTTPAMDVPPEQYRLIQGWAEAAEKQAGGPDDWLRRSLFTITVAPGRILAAVVDHFRILEPSDEVGDAKYAATKSGE